MVSISNIPKTVKNISAFCLIIEQKPNNIIDTRLSYTLRLITVFTIVTHIVVVPIGATVMCPFMTFKALHPVLFK